MDAAQKLLKSTVLLFAIALLMAAPGWAQPTLSTASSVTLAGPTYFTQSPVNSSDATTTNTGTAITFTVGAPNYSSDTSGSTTGWLAVSASSASTPSTLNFSLSRGTTAGMFNGARATVTLHPTNGAADVPITVTFNSTTTGGNTTLSASSNPVNLNAAVNSLAVANVTISTTSAIAVPFTSGTAVTSGNWLSISLSANSVSSSQNATLSITANSNGLQTGATYTGTVTLTPTAGGQALIINVNFTVGTGGNNNWTVNPSTAAWNYTTNSQSFPSTLVSVSTTTGSTAYNVFASTTNGIGWLRLSLDNGTASDALNLAGVGINNPFRMNVGSQANTLPTGQYSGQAIVSDSSGTQQASVSVTLTVNGGGTTTLTVTPNPITFNLNVSGSQQSQTVYVTSSTGGTLSVSPSLPSGLSYQLNNSTIPSGVQTAAFTVFANPAGLAANTYSGTMFVSVGTQSISVPVNMVVGGGGTGTTAVAPTSLTFAYQLGTDPLNFISRQRLAITGPAGPWSSSITTFTGTPWLKLNPTGGNSLPNPAGDAPVVSIDATGLAAGSYGGTITINTQGGTQQIQVSLNVGTGTILLPTPGSLVFAAQTGQAKPSPQIIFFSGSDGALNPLAITTTANNPWITVTNDANSATISTDQTGLTTGVYSGSVSVSQTGAANNPLVIPVVLVVNGGGSGGTGGNSNVTVSPTSVTFAAGAGSNPSPATQSITVSSASGTAPVSYTAQVTAGNNWLSVSPSSGSTQSSVTLTVNSSALAAGAYTGNLQISPSGGNVVNVPVSLTISSSPSVSATPTALSFTYQVGNDVPAAQQLTISGVGATFSATASSTGNWLAVSPASGSTPATVSVSVNPAGLAANTYTGTILVAGTGGALGSTTVTVTLTVTAPLPTITKVTNAASYATGSVSPGEIVTLFASDPLHPIGPATPVGLTLDSSGNVSTSIGGVSVTVGGFACPMVYASASQVSAVVPYQVKGFLSATVQSKYLGQSSNGVFVSVVTTIPGLFTANSSGTGPGAILNQNSSTNSPSNPATRGDTVVVYLTGEGETSPAGVTGKVTTVAAPPQPLTPAPLLPVSVTIGGQPANWTFAGEAPGFVSGVMQLNVTVPTNIAAGDQPIVVTIGGNPSQQGVTVSVK
jgi:uncharacterized protein (TIGR03437 family)